MHHLPILFQETRWDVARGEEQVERSQREDPEVDHVGDDVVQPCIVKTTEEGAIALKALVILLDCNKHQIQLSSRMVDKGEKIV